MRLAEEGNTVDRDPLGAACPRLKKRQPTFSFFFTSLRESTKYSFCHSVKSGKNRYRSKMSHICLDRKRHRHACLRCCSAGCSELSPSWATTCKKWAVPAESIARANRSKASLCLQCRTFLATSFMHNEWKRYGTHGDCLKTLSERLCLSAQNQSSRTFIAGSVWYSLDFSCLGVCARRFSNSSTAQKTASILRLLLQLNVSCNAR